MFVPVKEIAARSDSSLGDRVVVAGRMVAELLKHPSGIATLYGYGTEPAVASIDVTPNCPLRCWHCYLYGKNHQEEGTVDGEFLGKVSEMKKLHPGLVHCTWVGGEPMLRWKTLKEAVKFFPFNWVVTSGVLPIQGDGKDWKNVSFFVSIDGLERTHNQIRQPFKHTPLESGDSPLDNVYQTAKKNMGMSPAPVFVHTVINKLNWQEIPQLVSEWWNGGIARGFAFSLSTPIIDLSRKSGMSEMDEGLYLDREEKIAAVEMLLSVKKNYGDFVIMSEGMIKKFLPENVSEIWGRRCALPNLVYSADSKFKRKSPCVMGPGMDCEKCGCIIPDLVNAAKSFDFAEMRLVFQTLRS